MTCLRQTLTLLPIVLGNGYPEFCNRQYGNITEVCAHNSAFAIPNNAASNQALGIIDQLNDGVRMRRSLIDYVSAIGS